MLYLEFQCNWQLLPRFTINTHTGPVWTRFANALIPKTEVTLCVANNFLSKHRLYTKYLFTVKASCGFYYVMVLNIAFYTLSICV